MANPNIKDWGFGGKFRTREQDDLYRSRQKGVPKRRIWTKDYCIDQLNDLLDVLKKVLKDSEKLEKNNPKKLKDETVRDAITLINKIMDFMRYLYPPVQENVNLNIDLQLNNIIEEWMEKKKKLEVVNA